MISLDKAITARFKKGELSFEVLVDAENAWKLRRNEPVAIENVIAAREIFSDAKKGERAADADLNKAFGTNNFDAVVKKIVCDGELQLTTEQKRKMAEDRKKQLINLIARNAVDPRTHIPHPPQRIENALEQTKFRVDAFKNAEEQLGEAIAALRPIIPIRMEIVRIAVKIPAEHAPKAFGFIHNQKTIKEEWSSDGSLLALIETPAGLQSEFLDRLNKLTSGNNETKITERL